MSIPPLNGLIPGVIGLIGIFWGNWELMHGRRLPWSGIALLVGCLLWAVACYVLLPWSVR